LIKLKSGPLIEKYAHIYGCEIKDVLEWMNDYINHPEKYNAPEPTEKDRADSIKGYVEAMIKCSTYGRIKQALDQIKNDEARKDLH